MLAACGSDHAPAATSTSSSTSSAAPAVALSDTDCDFKGITAGARDEGDCTARGVAVRVVDRAHALHGADYDVQVDDVQADGTTVTLSLRVTNTLAAPHDFDRASNLVFLFVDQQYFGETPSAESDPGRHPFRLRTADLQPGETATGTVAFDLPPEHVGHLNATGSDAIFVSFHDQDKGFPTGTEPLATLGYIRLWK